MAETTVDAGLTLRAPDWMQPGDVTYCGARAYPVTPDGLIVDVRPDDERALRAHGYTTPARRPSKATAAPGAD